MKTVDIYTDGACSGNPGAGGYCAILIYNGVEKIVSGSEINTTNNRMELTAVIEGLSILKFPCRVYVVTDSQYVVNAFKNGWIYNWKEQGFSGRPNADLWIKLFDLVVEHQVTFTWIKGHAGHEYNERCDKLAKREASKFRY